MNVDNHFGTGPFNPSVTKEGHWTIPLVTPLPLEKQKHHCFPLLAAIAEHLDVYPDEDVPLITDHHIEFRTVTEGSTSKRITLIETIWEEVNWDDLARTIGELEDENMGEAQPEMAAAIIAANKAPKPDEKNEDLYFGDFVKRHVHGCMGVGNVFGDFVTLQPTEGDVNKLESFEDHWKGKRFQTVFALDDGAEVIVNGFHGCKIGPYGVGLYFGGAHC
eukprot:Trichotokara_eunicae@DN4928_c0_g1_i4.p1